MMSKSLRLPNIQTVTDKAGRENLKGGKEIYHGGSDGKKCILRDPGIADYH